MLCISYRFLIFPLQKDRIITFFTVLEKHLHFINVLFAPTDNLVRDRVNGELEKLKHNVHRILSDQQQDFAQAFGLHDELSSSEVNFKTADLIHA